MSIVRRVAGALFGAAAVLLGYTWAGYPLLLKLLSARRSYAPPTPPPRGRWPVVTSITTVYNEEHAIRRKLDNLLALEYPRDCLQILIVSDGSRDRTEQYVREYADRGVDLYPRPFRGGTTAAVNDAVERSRGEVILHSDVDTLHQPDFLLKIMPHYSHPKVGVVEGEFRFRDEDASGLSQNQSLYWRFEMFLRRAESRLGVLSTVSGGLMSFRREVFQPLAPAHSVDGTLPKLAVQKGYRVVHESEAIVYDELMGSVQGELRRRARMTSRNLAGWSGAHAFPNPLKHPGVFAALVSHKILRWLTPVFMLVALVSNVVLAGSRLYRAFLAGQLLFYVLAAVGYVLELRHVRLRLFSAPFSFCLANLGFLVGMWKALRRQWVVVYRSER